jgi:ectoine hydroxylase-related dioxygenase (phytanoyl-CoA dioxygenase family)
MANLIDGRDWANCSLGERIRRLEVDGYAVMPDMLSPEQVAALKAQTATLKTFAMDYSVHQQCQSRIQFEGGPITELIAHRPMIRFLGELFGENPVFMTYEYARSEPGHPGISLHTDGQPYGSEIFGYECSCPVMVKVLYYLDDLTPDVSPFCVIPGSHLSMHGDGNPYKRYRDHPEKVMITVGAGTAVIIHQRLFHGTYPNVGNRSREMLQIGYRPLWSGPIQEVPTWKPEELAQLPEKVRALFIDRNLRRGDYYGGHKPPDMASEAPGINPSRWQRT